jgi:hypothetical protein
MQAKRAAHAHAHARIAHAQPAREHMQLRKTS